jgi:hypothetical protein
MKKKLGRFKYSTDLPQIFLVFSIHRLVPPLYITNSSGSTTGLVSVVCRPSL